ncbi:MAG: DEAD/DEAH box helicase [Atopobiaceae bacterium]|nr:DEAD/DEAH box helicase [Atopobiaceae bacterium]MBR3313411.1 DEAD/DEAH box helicase [Atopobiaceae bacterium]
MSLEASLKRLCTPAVLSRGKRLAAAGDKLHRRRCRYEGDEVVLDARVDSSASWDGPHRPQVVVDEGRGEVTYFECDCSSARGAGKPCKHAAALVLDFCARPDAYDGYDATGHVRTSRAIARLIERAETQKPAAVASSTEPHGRTVSLDPTFTYEAGFGVRFRVVGAQGAYALKSISEFVANVEAGSFASYGKSLAFAHVEEAFTSLGWKAACLLVRAVRNRRAFAFDRAVGTGPLGTSGAPQRQMHLSSVELWDLLDAFMDKEVGFEDLMAQTDADRMVRRFRVRNANPDLGFSLAPVEAGAYELVRRGNARFATSGGRVLAWDDHTLYCCDPEFSRAIVALGDVLTVGAQKLVVAERDASAFAAIVLPLLEKAAHTEVPEKLEALRPVPCDLQFYLDRTERGITCEPYAVYGAQRIELIGGSGTSEVDGFVRDIKAEALGRGTLRRYFSLTEDGTLLISAADSDAMAAFVFEGVAELQSVGTVFATDAYDRLKSKVRPRPRAELAVRSNLLDLRLSADGLDARELAELLESYKLRKRYHKLRDGTFMDLAAEGVGVDLGDVAALVEELGISERQLAQGSVTLPAYRALLLDEEVLPTWRNASLDDYLGKVRDVGAKSYEPPASLAHTLRSYQVTGFEWMSSLVDQGLAGILADEMGLGKSVQLISLLLARREEARRIGPSLVVCPASLVYNWAQEFEKFAPELRVTVVAGTAGERDELRARRSDVLITSYDLLRRDVDGYAGKRFWLMALDEAQYIKNHGTLAARAVKALDCAHRFALTGTPVENRLSELWSIFDFLMPGLLGDYEGFRERFERPVAEEGNREKADRLARAISPFVLRRTKRDVLNDLPEKLEQVVYARMGEEQRALYDAQVAELRTQLTEQMGEQSGAQRMQVLAALMRLRQTCCDPRLVFEDYEGESCKVETILTLVGRVVDAGERLLLFSQFTSFLQLIAQSLDEQGMSYSMLTGATPKRRRMELVEEFNAGDTNVFLISLKAGGTGLNLTGASVVIHADPWWNAAAQDQATDRAHRIGQTRDVTVYKVICAETIEERIQELQRRKARLASQILGVESGSVSLADLADLLA